MKFFCIGRVLLKKQCCKRTVLLKDGCYKGWALLKNGSVKDGFCKKWGGMLEPLVGFEPTTPRLQITCSGQLS